MKSINLEEVFSNKELERLVAYLMENSTPEEEDMTNDAIERELEEANDAFREAARQDLLDEASGKMSLEYRPLLDRVIYHFLRDCEKDHKLPTYEQAKTIELLDNLVQKYN